MYLAGWKSDVDEAKEKEKSWAKTLETTDEKKVKLEKRQIQVKAICSSLCACGVKEKWAKETNLKGKSQKEREKTG